jgi:hypothetical protein
MKLIGLFAHLTTAVYSICALCRTTKEIFQRLEYQRITEQQTQVHLRLSWGSVHGSYCSNIELGGLNWALLYVLIMWMHRGARPKVSLRWQDIRVKYTYTLHRMTENLASRREVTVTSSFHFWPQAGFWRGLFQRVLMSNERMCALYRNQRSTLPASLLYHACTVHVRVLCTVITAPIKCI